MITKFKVFEAIKPELDEKTIRVENREREWYLDFYFDDSGTIIWVDNKWDIRVPNWGSLSFEHSLNIIRIWAKRYDPKSETYYILKNNADKYNL